MTYNETIDYLFSKLPMFQRQGNEAMRKYNLEGVTKLCDYLGNPERKLASIHVAGTNGKGSTSSMIASIFQSMGFNVGLYTSPHLIDFSERIKLNGIPIPPHEVIEFTERVKSFIEKEGPSFFEVTTAMAFDYFSRTTDISIIEVGLGGNFDSTNIINPLISIITQISYDHVEFLGDSLVKIASEKAGIIKNKIPVIISTTQTETADVFLQKAANEKATISFGDQLFTCFRQKIQFDRQILSFKSISPEIQTFPSEFEIETDLTGKYQMKNILGVLAFVEIYNSSKSYDKTKIKRPISTSDVDHGLKKVKMNTGFRGRMDILSEQPLVIADVAHNPDGIKALFDHLNEIKINPSRFVMGVVREKDLSSILPFFPKNAIYYFVKPDIPRGLDAEDLRKKAAEYGLISNAYSTVEAGIAAAMIDSDKTDTIITTGSIFTVAEIIAFFEKNHMKETENDWQTLSSEIKYDNPWITLTEHQVINPTGGQGIYGVVHFKNLAIGIVPIDFQDDEPYIHLVGQFRYPLNEYSYEIPEGGGDPDLDPLISAQRELSEETGMTAQNWKLILKMHLSNSVSDEVAYIFLAKNLQKGEAHPDETEVLTQLHIPLKQAYQMVIDGKITDSMSVAAILRVHSMEF